MKSISPLEYEVLYALFQLKSEGNNSASFKQICLELNNRRKQRKKQGLSPQHVNYYLKRLSKRPFIKKTNNEKIRFYSLRHGIWKLNQSPPLCIYINNETSFMLPCDKVNNCKQEKPTVECIKELVNIGKITLPPYT